MKLRSFLVFSALSLTFSAMTASAQVNRPFLARLEIHGPVVAHPVSSILTIDRDGTVRRDNRKIAEISGIVISELAATIDNVDASDSLQDLDAGKPSTVGGGARDYTVFPRNGASTEVGVVKNNHRNFLSRQFRFSQRIVDILNGFAALPVLSGCILPH